MTRDWSFPLSKYHKSVVPSTPASSQLPLVAIVGRPNVGKSTLFNRLTHSRRSIVGDEPGITRDRIYGEYDWAGREFRVVDTGGIVPDDPELIPTEIYAQAKVALAEADALILVVDARTELASPDYDLVKLLIRGGKPVFLAVNKVEGEAMAAEAENFRRLGLRNVYPISSEHGLGIGDLLDAISEAIPAPPETAEALQEDRTEQDEAEADLQAEEDEISEGGPIPPAPESDDQLAASEEDDDAHKLHRTHGEFEQHETSVAIIGRPNVGKSTLFNHLTGSRRAIVGDEPGITRDRLYGEAEWLGHEFRVVDTGGIIPDDKDFIPSEIFRQAKVAFEEAAAIVMVVDARTEIAGPDRELARLLARTGKPLFLAVNKMDSDKQDSLLGEFHSLGMRNIFPISAEHGRGIDDLLDAVVRVMPARARTTAESAEVAEQAEN